MQTLLTVARGGTVRGQGINLPALKTTELERHLCGRIDGGGLQTAHAPTLFPLESTQPF